MKSVPSFLFRSTPMTAGRIAACAAGLAFAACSEPQEEASTITTAAITDPGAGHFVGVRAFGDGCPQNAVTTAVSPDGQAFTTIFSSFVASSGEGNDPAARTRGCLLQVEVSAPAGWSFSLDDVIRRGFVAVDAGVTATRQSLAVVPGSRPVLAPATRVTGEHQDGYVDADIGSHRPAGWSACGASGQILIATQLSLEGSGGSGC